MPPGNYHKIHSLKFRFISILNYLGSQNAKLAALEIGTLPDQASDGFHDAYLTAKLTSITLTFLTKDEFKRFKSDPLRSQLMAALFDHSDIENQMDESIDNVFAFCEDHPKESLDACLESLLQTAAKVSYKEYFDELKYLKKSCDSFIVFYEKNTVDIEKTLAHYPDSVSLETTHKGPEPEALQYTTFLSNPAERAIIEMQGSVLINNLKPCLGLVIIAENESKNLACSASHHMAAYNYLQTNAAQDFIYRISALINELKSKGYTNQVRFFLTGGNFATFPLTLKLAMHFWHSKNIAIDLYLMPSPQSCWTYCLVDLANGGCSIRAGAELYDYDIWLCTKKGISYEVPEASSSESEESDLESSEEESSEDSSSLSSEESLEEKSDEQIVVTKKRTRMPFFNQRLIDDSSDEEPLTKKYQLG